MVVKKASKRQQKNLKKSPYYSTPMIHLSLISHYIPINVPFIYIYPIFLWGRHPSSGWMNHQGPRWRTKGLGVEAGKVAAQPSE